MYEYDVTDVYNTFGGGHNYRLSLFRDGDRIRYWDYDSILGIGGLLARKKIKSVEKIYGAKRR